MSSQPLDPLPDWDPEERPRMPGSPALVKHSPGRRLAYGLVGLLVITTSGLGTGLVSANLQNIQGHLGLTPSEAAWLPAVYVMFNASANLILFKCRQRFGIYPPARPIERRISRQRSAWLRISSASSRRSGRSASSVTSSDHGMEAASSGKMDS